MPQAANASKLVQLNYTHFTVLLNRGRRSAAATAVNIDGARLVDVARGDDWHLDPRVPVEDQAGLDLYRDNDLDRGHLVRRRDPVWGSPAVADRANADTSRTQTRRRRRLGSTNQNFCGRLSASSRSTSSSSAL
jgi:endonuclease G